MSQDQPSPFQTIHLNSDDNGLSLGRALKSRLPDWSWGKVREAILKRRVQVNGNLCLDEARKVTERDVVKLWNQSLPKPIGPEDIRIVYVDDFLVVVEKPPGITSTRHFEERTLPQKRRQLQPTLEELMPRALDHHFQQFRPRKEDEDGGNRKLARKPVVSASREYARKLEQRLKRFSVVAVHRLDRDTSGLMIFARTPSIAQSLGKAFRRHDVERRYHAVVHGSPAAQTFDNVLIRDRGDGRRGSLPAGVDPSTDRTSQHAITHIKPIEALGPYTMIECRLETGRTHQIRIHLAEAGHMLCGEPIYNKPLDGPKIADASGAPRQALHSATLEFNHPVGGERLSFRMPWPPDLHRWLANLRKRASEAK